MLRSNIYFLSDFHFGLSDYKTEAVKEEKIVRFLKSIEADAKRVVLLGDIFDFWFEYIMTIPKGFVLFQAQIKTMVKQGIVVDYFCGNHDLWQKNYFAKELGVNIYRKKYQQFEFDKKIFVLGHGDGLNDKDIGYKIIDMIFSNHFGWWLFSFLPGCIALGFGHLWSRNNRKKHKKYDKRDLKEKEYMYQFCEQYSQKNHVDYFVFGHRHIKNEFVLKTGSKYINTGTWIDDSPYAIWDGKDLKLKTFS